jgi:hypothetical protein
MQYQLSVGPVQVSAPLVWVDHRQSGPAFAVFLVVVTEDRYPRKISDHVVMNLLPSGD